MTTLQAGDLAAADRSADEAGWFRPDIDGLRAVAIVLVVAYHAEVPGFSGGFVGVDVFFVISGWLITRNLLRESSQSGAVDLRRFWARRIRRLVPGLALMIVITAVGSAVILSRGELDDVMRQAFAATLYVSNFLFASESQGYFGDDVSGSPFLHTWSLGVEEQFYLFWPVLVGVAFVAMRRRTVDHRRALLVVFAALMLGSFLLSRHLTAESSTWAFYGLQSRVWEFAAAGLLATTGWRLRRVRMRLVLGVGGLALIGWASVALSDATPYPGTAALLPVLGTLGVIVAGDRGTDGGRSNPITRALGTAPMQWLGRVSYSWYLWHWPVLVLAVAAFDRSDVPFRVGAVAVSLPVAWSAFRWVENPVRFSRSLSKSTGRTFVVGAGITAVALLMIVATGWYVDSRPSSPLDVQIEEARSLEGRWPTCEMESSSEGDEYCVGGDLDADTTVMLIGDSKAFGWYETIRVALEEEEVRVVTAAWPSCPAVEVDVPLPRVRDHVATCRRARARTDRVIHALQPDLIVLSQGEHYLHLTDLVVDGKAPGETEQAQIWGDAFETLIAGLDDDGRSVVVILDNPAFAEDPNVCLARTASASGCELSRDEALSLIAPLRQQELEVVTRLGIDYFDATEAICGPRRCDLGNGEYLHYFDASHLSARTMFDTIPEMSDLLRRGLGRS